MSLSHEEILQVLTIGCSEQHAADLRCPICNSRLTFMVNPNGHTFFIRCPINSSHLSMHGKSATPPDWWTNHVTHGGWTH